MSGILALPELLTSVGARRVDPVHAVWKLDDPRWPFGARARLVHRGRPEVIAWLLGRVPTLYLVTSEDDEMRAIAGASATGTLDTWRLSPTINIADLESAVLRHGGWSLYGGAEPLDPKALPNAFDTEPAALVPALEHLHLTLLVESWHDDIYWRIAIADQSLCV